MIDLGGKRVIALQQRTADLEKLVEALSARLANAEEQLAASRDQINEVTKQFQAHISEFANSKQRIEALVNVVSEQDSAIEQLNERQGHYKEMNNRFRADLARFERQAIVEFTEFRQIHLALAERIAGRKNQ